MPNTDAKLDISGFKGGTLQIPKGVTSIPPYEFIGVDGLEKVIIPDTVREIGDCAFVERDSLREVIMEGEEIYLSSRTFDECTNLEKITLPKHMEEIPEAVFKGCSSLNEITLPQNARQIGAHAFWRCHSLEHITLPDGLNVLGYAAFQDSGLTSVEIPEDVWEIDDYAFSDCDSLREVTMKGERMRLLDHAFEGCTNLEKVILPKYMERIQEATFKDCSKLQHINLPDTIESIDEYAFSGCTSLESIVIPKNIKTIDSYAFAGCQSLKRITFSGTFPEVAWDTFDRIPNNVVFEYRGMDIPKKHLDFADDLADGLGMGERLQILVAQREILQDDTFSPILVTKLANAEHKYKLSEAVEKYKKSFQTVGFYEISDHVDVDMKERLTQLFKNNAASRGVVPKIIDALTIAATTLNIEPEQIVKSFEDKKFRDAIIAMRSCHKGNHFFDCEAALFAMTFDVNTVKQFILENPHKDYASVLLCKGYKNGDEKCLNMAKWIAYHPDSSREMIEKLYKCQDYVDIRPDMTVDQVRAQVSCGEGEIEIHQIEDQYDGKFVFKDCVCNLPKTEVELGRYKAYIMDGQDPRQVMLGYDTNCCQHLNGAGETAMMYGLANPAAGFFVIEDKGTGKILAQAETWEYAPEYRDVRTEKINLQTIFEDDMYLANQLYKGVENYIEEGYCTDGWGSSESADYYLASELSFESWEIGADKKAYGPAAGDDEHIAAIVNHNESVEILDLPLIVKRIARESRLMKNFNEYAMPGVELTADGSLYKIECRKNDDKTLVFDNIEFADDRQIDQFAPILGKWCEASPYHDIIMGDGYNAMNNGKMNHTDGVEPPVNGDLVRLMDKDEIIENSEDELGSQYPSPDIAYEAIANKELDPEDYGIYGLSYDDLLPYTDADESCSVLKADNRVEPYFRESLETYYEKHPEEKENTKMEKDSEAEFDAKKNQKKRHTGRGR